MTNESYAQLPSYHRIAISIFKLLPVQVGVYFLRAFNLVLRQNKAYLVRTSDDFSIICSARDLVQVCILQFGHWEPNIVAVIKQHVRSGSVAVDVGANIGYDTLLLSKLVGPTGAVVAFEASSKTTAALRRNLSLNNASNVRVEQSAISDTNGTVILFAPDETNSGNASIMGDGNSKPIEEVNAIPLHEALSPDEKSQVEFIKIDVEGAEQMVLGSIVDNISNFPKLRAMVVEISPSNTKNAWSEIWTALECSGFEAFSIENEYSYSYYLGWRGPIAPKRIERVPSRHTDVLFCRTGHEVSQSHLQGKTSM